MKIIKKYLTGIILILLMGTAFAQSNKVKIVVNKDNPLTSISVDQVSRLFLKKDKKWDNGSKVVPVDLSSDSDTREAFSEEFHGKSVSAIKAYWQKKIFTGKGIPPVELDNDTKVIDFVSSNSGAVGYVSSATSASGVKELKVTK